MTSQDKTGSGPARGGSAFRRLRPVFIGFHPCAADIELGVDSVGHRTLQAARRQLVQALPSAKLELHETEAGFVLRATMPGGCTGDTFGRDERRTLTELVEPTYTARATAAVKIVRENGHHKGTVATLTVSDGRAKLLDETAINKIAGVQLSQVSDDDSTILFSYELPTTNRSEIEELIGVVAAALGLHITRPVDIRDPNPEFALLGYFAYKPPQEAQD